jgi:hypothetical protein
MDRHSLMDLHYTDNRIATIEYWSLYEHIYTYVYQYFGRCFIIRKRDMSEGFRQKNI